MCANKIFQSGLRQTSNLTPSVGLFNAIIGRKPFSDPLAKANFKVSFCCSVTKLLAKNVIDPTAVEMVTRLSSLVYYMDGVVLPEL